MYLKESFAERVWKMNSIANNDIFYIIIPYLIILIDYINTSNIYFSGSDEGILNSYPMKHVQFLAYCWVMYSLAPRPEIHAGFENDPAQGKWTC